MARASKKKAIAKPAMAGPKVKMFDPMANESDAWTLPAYLSAGSAEDGEEFHPDKKVTLAAAYLPSMVINLPMDTAGNEIETDGGYVIYSHGIVEPLSDDETLASLRQNMISVTLSVRVHRWNYGWPEHMTADKYPGADLEAPARSNPSALKAP